MSYYPGETAVPTGTAAPITADKPGSSIVIRAAEANTQTVYIGGQGVTTATGFPLKADEWVSVSPVREHELYCIAGATGQKLRWMVTG